MRDIAIFVGLRIVWVLAKWWLDKKNRADYARELVELFKKVQSKGDVLANDLGKEMSKQSNTPWKDIPIRGMNDEEGPGDDRDVKEGDVPASGRQPSPSSSKEDGESTGE